MKDNTPLKEHQLARILLSVATLVTLVSMFVFAVFEGTKNEITVKPSDEEVEADTINLATVRDIGQWEFLTINDEELVDTTASRLLGKDKQLTRIYYGTLHFGLDLSKMSNDAVRMVGDTVDVTLPSIILLDENFIDEARTKSFYEEGTWDQATRERLYQKAKKQMLKRCMTEDNINIAQANAAYEIGQLFRSLGYENVDVHF